MVDIFINYRTADARYGAAATYELLADRFERERIFLDNQSMRPGAKYPAELRAALESMRVLLVLIGPRWMSPHPSNNRLLPIERGGDWVRREIRRALQRAVPIVPILLDGASLPDPGRLPQDVRGLVHHQTIAVDHRHLRRDVDALGDRLAELLPKREAGRPGARAGRVSRPPVPLQLPPAVRTFIGRGEQMAELDRVLCSAATVPGDAVPIVVVDGTAGVGKTSLLVTWAHRVADRFPDGILFADLRGYGPGAPQDPSLVLASFLRALGIPEKRVPDGLDAQVGMYRSLLAGKRVLVALDNAIDAEQVRPLLPGTASCRVFITSRTVLTGLVIAEGAHRIVLDLFTETEACDLVHAVIGADRAAATPDAVAELARLCAHLPLALRVAAARVANNRHLDLSDIVHELTQTRGSVDALSRTGDERTAVRTVIGWSLAGLPFELGRVFRRLGVQPALAFGVHAVAALLGTDPEGARRRLDELADVHLVEPSAPGRYEIHALLHGYAAERADDDDVADERLDALAALLDWYAATATAADRLIFPTQPALEVALSPVSVPSPFADRAGAWAWLTEERATLLALLRRTASDGPRTVAIALAAAARFLALMPRAAWHDRLDADTRGLAAAVATGEKKAEAAFLRRRADTHQMLGDWAASDADLRRSVALAEADGDHELRGFALCGLGRNQKLQHRDAEAMTLYSMALPLVRGVGTGYVEAIVEANLSQLSARLGRHQDALRHAERELALHRGTGDTVGEAYALHDLARARQGLGDHDAAADLSERAAATFRAIAGTDEYLVAALETMAESVAHLGDVATAARCLDEATGLLAETDEPRAEALRCRAAHLRSSASARLPARLRGSCAAAETRPSAGRATGRTPRAR